MTSAGKPGTLTRVGLGTFVDPRNGGERMNDVTMEELVRVMTIDGEEYLFFKAFPIRVLPVYVCSLVERRFARRDAHA